MPAGDPAIERLQIDHADAGAAGAPGKSR